MWKRGLIKFLIMLFVTFWTLIFIKAGCNFEGWETIALNTIGLLPTTIFTAFVVDEFL
jgi:hypothetical protein